MLAALFLVLWPIAELLVAIEVARLVGVLVMVLLLVISMPLGLRLMRAEGRGAWRRLRLTAAQGTPPGREVLDAGLIVAGGTLLIVPGFITDVVGLLLLIAPTRRFARSLLIRNLGRRMMVAAAGRRPAPGRGYDVDSTASEIDRAQLH